MKVRLANWISYGFHPLAVCIPSLFIAIYLDTQSFMLAAMWSGISVIVFLLPLLAFLLLMIKTGRYSDFDISVRQQRWSAYLAGVITMSFLLFTYHLAKAPHIAHVCLITILIGMVASSVINQFTKISLHAMVNCCCAVGITYLSWPIGLLLIAATVATGWARVSLNHHTLGQVALGWAVAVLSAVGVFKTYL